MIGPQPLAPGDVVAVIAPSGPFEHALAWRGLAFLAERYKVRVRRDAFRRSGYLAGDDARRREELSQALVAPDVRAVLAMRGGYGASRILDGLPWGSLAESPRWLVGFSDITALHVEAARVGVMSLHAPHVAVLGRCDRVARAELVAYLEDPHRERVHDGLRTIVGGDASGPLFGGNLALLHACAAAGRLAVPAGAVVFLEDVGERPYRLDRMLTTLLSGGHLASAGAFVLGDFTDCGPGPDGVEHEAVLAERLAPLGVPVVAGLAAGHGARNLPLVLGAPARVSAGRLTVGAG